MLFRSSRRAWRLVRAREEPEQKFTAKDLRTGPPERNLAPPWVPRAGPGAASASLRPRWPRQSLRRSRLHLEAAALIVLIAGGRGVRGAEDEAPEQVHHVDGALGVENLAAVGDVVFRAARLQRHIVAAEQAVGNDARRGVGWQADGIADAQRDDGEVGFRIEPLLHHRSEEHTSELQSLMRNSYAVFCLKKKTKERRSISI